MCDNMFRFLLEYEMVTTILKAALMGPKPLLKKLGKSALKIKVFPLPLLNNSKENKKTFIFPPFLMPSESTASSYFPVCGYRDCICLLLFPAKISQCSQVVGVATWGFSMVNIALRSLLFSLFFRKQ